MALFDPAERELLERVLPGIERFLAVRERASAEVRDRLRQRRLCTLEEAERFIQYLENSGQIDDRRFAVNRARYRLGAGYGPLYIQNDLQRLGLPRAAIAAGLALLEDEEIVTAAKYAAERLARTGKTDQKLYNALYRRGFSSRHIRMAQEAIDESRG
jgi:SOS response regulatory protein OraA/RecX